MIKNLKMQRNWLEQTIEKFRTSPQFFIRHCCVAVCSFIISYSTVFGGISPFGIALITSVPSNFIHTAFLGVAVGYIAGQPLTMMIRYILLIIVLRMFFIKISQHPASYNEIWFLPPAVVFSLTFLSGIVAIAFEGFSLNSFGLILCEAAVSAICTYFFARLFEIKNLSEGFGNMQSRDLVCLLFCVGTFLLALSTFEVADVSFAKILSGFLILIASYFGNEGVGTVAGITGGIAIGLHSSSLYDTVSITFSGLISGVFSPLGKAGTVISFVLTKFCIYLISGQESGFFILLFESVLSIFLFLMIPQKLMPEIQRLFNISVKETVNFQSRKDMSEKLRNASECVESISESINKISDSLKKVSESSDKGIYCRVQNDVCKACRKYDVCWEKCFSETYKHFEITTNLFRENERVENENLPKKFVNSCVQINNLISSFEKHYRHSKSKREEEMRVASSRNMLYDQLNCMSKTLLNFSSEFSKETFIDTSTAYKVKEIMRENGINVASISCPVNNYGIMKIEASCRHIDTSLDKNKLLKQIEEITLRKFEKPEIKYLENGITVGLLQKPWMSVDIGAVQYPCESSSLCGDYQEAFYENGIQTIVISDGMGTGGRAAVDSAMTAEFFGKLIRSGFDDDTALKIVNSSMLVKSSYESLSTIDIAKIDLFTGKVRFLKAGAAVSFVKKSGKCHTVESSSLPIGILRDISFAEESIGVSPGDLIVMVSDGVTVGGTEKICEEIENWNGSSAQGLAQKIALKATEQNGKYPSDDITVVVALVGKM